MLPGDFDGDGKVAFEDFFVFADNFGSTSEDVNWNPVFDLVSDGEINFQDFFVFADNFGTEAQAKLIALAQEYLGLPTSPRLEQNYPNPFNHKTVIVFALPSTNNVELTIFNLVGQQVATLAEGVREAGTYTIHWNGRDEDDRELSSGVYLYRLRTGETQMETRKLVLLR